MQSDEKTSFLNNINHTQSKHEIFSCIGQTHVASRVPDFVSTFILTDLKGSFETENSLENACLCCSRQCQRSASQEPAEHD